MRQILWALFLLVMGAYLKDFVSFVVSIYVDIVSKYSEKARRRRRIRLVSMAKEIRALKSDSRLLITHGIDLVVRHIFLGSAFIIGLIALPSMQFYEEYPQYDPFRSLRLPGNEQVKPLATLLVITLIIVVFAVAFLTNRKIIIFQRVNRGLRRWHKLSRL